MRNNVCKRNCGNSVEEDFEGREVGGRICGTLLQGSEEHTREGHGMKLGECLLDLVGRKPVGSWERASLSRAGQVETRCSDLGVN